MHSRVRKTNSLASSPRFHPPRTARRAAMALLSLSGDEQRILFTQLCNVLEPRVAVYLSSTCNELRELTQALLQQLRTDHEAATALCHKLGLRSCKELREAKVAHWIDGGLSAADLALLGTLGSVLPALETLDLYEMSGSAGPDGVQQLAEGLGAGALLAVTLLQIFGMHVGDTGASALAAALGRGALPRLKNLQLVSAGIGDAALVALAPALRQLPALECLFVHDNPLGDEGLAALVAPPPPPPPAGVPPPSAGVLTKLKVLFLQETQVTDAGCATLAAALDSGAMPALERVDLAATPASAAAKATVEPPFATLVLLGAHVYYGGTVTARARSGPALLEATEATPSETPHSAVTTSRRQ
eukprot:scaffold76159_cov51-Phaeocystis_antarctica.AAC.3